MKRSHQQAQLIASFFDLKDKKDFQEKTLMKIEDLYNLTITPRPTTLINLTNYYKEVDFAALSNMTADDAIQKELDKIIAFDDDLEEFGRKLEALEIKLKRYVAVKQGLNKDEELNELKNMIKILSDKPKKGKTRKSTLMEIKEEESEGEDSDDEAGEELTLEEMAAFCDMKISEIVINFHANLNEEGHKFVGDIKREIEPDLLMVLNDTNDQEFLKEAEINDTKIDQLETKLRDLQLQQQKVKRGYTKYEKKMALQDDTKIKKSAVHIAKHELVKKIDKLGNLKKYRSSGCLEIRDCRFELTKDMKDKKQFLKNTLLLQEVVLDKKEQLTFTQKNFNDEKHSSYDQLKELFLKNKFKKSGVKIEDIVKKAETLKNKTMKEHALNFVKEFNNLDSNRAEAENQFKDGSDSFDKISQLIKSKFNEVKAKVDAVK